MSATLIVSTVATHQVLSRFEVIEKVPIVGAFAGETELVAGTAWTFGFVLPKAEGDITRGVALGMIISGANKVLQKYLPK